MRRSWTADLTHGQARGVPAHMITQGKGDCKGTSFPHYTFHINMSTHQIRNIFRNGQTQADAVYTAESGIFLPAEGFKDLV